MAFLVARRGRDGATVALWGEAMKLITSRGEALEHGLAPGGEQD
jgi:hypothetical protein